MQQTFRHRDQHIPVDLQAEGAGKFRAVIGDSSYEVHAEFVDPTTLILSVNGSTHTVRIARAGQVRHVALAGESFALTPEAPGTSNAGAGTLASPKIIAPMPGKVLQVLVTEGQEIAEGDGLLILEAMKMENRVVAEANGTVKKVNVVAGQMVDGGALMMELEFSQA